MSLPDPIVLLDARAKYVHPAFQLTRASTKAVFDTAGRMVTVPPNAIGWDHDPATGQARGYLAEPSRTNLLRHSNALDEGYWIKYRASITPNAIAGPDGGAMAKLVENTDAGPHSVLRAVPVDDTSALTFSVILKAAERRAAHIRITDEASPPELSCPFNLDDGTAGSVNASGGATAFGSGIEDLGGGYYRCWLAGSLGGGAMDNVRFETRILADGTTGYTGDGTSGLYIGYCQAEKGSYPTSYIETGGATATRAIERLTLPSITSQPWWRNDEWSMVIEYHNRGFELGANTLSNRILSFDNFAFMITYATSGILRARGSILASATNPFLSSQDAQVLRRNRIAFAISDDGFQAAANGALTSTDTVTGQLGDVPLALGASPHGADFAAATGNYRVTYYPARLSNADLQSLTAMQE